MPDLGLEIMAQDQELNAQGEKKERQRPAKKQTLNYRQQTDSYQGHGGQEERVNRQCPCGEHQVLYASGESLYCTPEAYITLLNGI